MASKPVPKQYMPTHELPDATDLSRDHEFDGVEVELRQSQTPVRGRGFVRRYDGYENFRHSFSGGPRRRNW